MGCTQVSHIFCIWDVRCVIFLCILIMFTFCAGIIIFPGHSFSGAMRFIWFSPLFYYPLYRLYVFVLSLSFSLSECVCVCATPCIHQMDTHTQKHTTIWIIICPVEWNGILWWSVQIRIRSSLCSGARDGDGFKKTLQVCKKVNDSHFHSKWIDIERDGGDRARMKLCVNLCA